MKCNTVFAGVAALVFFAGCEKQAPAPSAAAPTSPPSGAPSAAPKATTPAPAAPAAAPAANDKMKAPAAAPAGSAAGATGSTVAVMGLTFKVPEGWKQVPPSNSMRLAEVVAADPSGDAGKACTAAFSSAGGDVQANIGRWANQVQDAAGQSVKAEAKQRTVAGMPVHTVELTGKYLGMGDGAAKENWTLHGAIIEAPEGLLFIKMTGPADRMKTLAAGFDGLIDSMTKK